MSDSSRRGRVFLLVDLALSAASWGAPIVFATPEDLGGGLFQYHLLVSNLDGDEPISGLLVVNAGSVFRLSGTSFIGGPQDVGGNASADWDALAPIPPIIDLLFYFSLDPAGDVQVGESLGGFFFRSSRHPDTLGPGDFAVEVIGARTASQLPLGDAQVVPEPSTLLLLSGGLAGFVTSFRRRKRSVSR